MPLRFAVLRANSAQIESFCRIVFSVRIEGFGEGHTGGTVKTKPEGTGKKTTGPDYSLSGGWMKSPAKQRGRFVRSLARSPATRFEAFLAAPLLSWLDLIQQNRFNLSGSRTSLFACLIFATANVAAGADFSSAGDPGYPSRCQDRSVLNWITGNFAWAERNQWQRGFTIEEISSPRLRYQVNYGPTMIPHDHCQAQARMTNGRVWPVYYTVERGQGFASIGDKVRYCIVGLDPWYVYGAACSTVR